MSPCTEIVPLLPFYEWGAASPGEREACDQHLAGCASCLAAFLSLKRVREDAAAFDERPAPSTREALRRRVARRAPGRRPVWFAAAAAAALVAVALALRFLAPAASPPSDTVLIDAAPPTEDLL